MRVSLTKSPMRQYLLEVTDGCYNNDKSTKIQNNNFVPTDETSALYNRPPLTEELNHNLVKLNLNPEQKLALGKLALILLVNFNHFMAREPFTLRPLWREPNVPEVKTTSKRHSLNSSESRHNC